MELAPQALDAVVLGAVGRQEVEREEIPVLSEEAADALARVDHVVVQDEVDAPRVRVQLTELLEKSQEELRVLAVGCDEPQPGAVRDEGTRHIPLLVPSRRDNDPLVTGQHPVTADAWVEMDVDLVLVEEDLITRQVPTQR